MQILGIETSCDETGVALVSKAQGLLAHTLHSQVATHAAYGGVVPELASRDHIQRLLPLIRATLADAGIALKAVDGIAYTAGPGLIGALLVGAAVGRSLAWALNIPAAGIHHLEAHLLAPLLEADPPQPPFVALLVSGGHSLLVLVSAIGQYELLGESLDDAAGEAFDKTAKLLGLGYPGGPQLAALARQGTPGRFVFPRPMTDRPGLNLSFSGLKTHVAHVLAQTRLSAQTKADIALAFEEAVIDTLACKCRRALEYTGLRQLVVAGGVGANQRLRDKLGLLAEEVSGRVFFPRPEFCTDNGAMVAYAGLVRLQAGQADDLSLQARARWALTSLDPGRS